MSKRLNRRFVYDKKRKRVVPIEELEPEPQAKRCKLALGVGGQKPAAWPMKSDVMGINPVQIPEQMAEDKKRGVKVDYDKHTGQVIWNDPNIRRRYAEAYHHYDRNGGFSDPQTRDRH